MQSNAETVTPPRTLRWTGRVLSALALLFLLFDGVIKVMVIPPVVESFVRLGVPPRFSVAIGILELTCLLVYLTPWTSVLGAILLTGFLGGATMLHVRMGDPVFSHILFPSYVGLMLWGGLFLREARLRALIPLRSRSRP